MRRNSEIRTTNDLTEKTCTRCGVWYPAHNDHFAPFRQGVIGLHPWCRDCLRQSIREKQARNGKPIRKIMSPAGSPPKIQNLLAQNVSQILETVTRDVDERARYKAYLIVNGLTGESYVGITERRLRERWKQHLVGGIAGTGYLLHKVMQRDGIENFTFEFIACAINRHDLHQLEVQLIDQYRSVELGYNQTRGGAAGEAVGNEIVVAGRSFISISSAARAFRLDEATVFQRLHRYRWTTEQALGLAAAPERKGRITNYEFEGHTFDSFVAACKCYGLEDSAVRRRIRDGWTCRQAFGIDPAPVKARPGKSIDVGGMRFDNVSMAAKHFGIKSHTVAKRMAGGMTPDEAFGLTIANKKQWLGRSVNVSGKEFCSLTAAAKTFGIDRQTAGEHLRKGWTVEQTFGLVPPKARSENTTGTPITLSGITYPSYAKAAVALGLNPKIVHKRLMQLGWTTEQAFGLDTPPTKNANNSKVVTVGGNTYSSIASACTAFGITRSTVRRRVAGGMPLEDAITIPSQKTTQR